MIVKMHKAYIVARSGDCDRLLEALRDLGVVHLQPLDPAKAVAEEETVAAINRLNRAMQVLREVRPTGKPPDISAHQAAHRALQIQRDSAERHSRLNSLHRQLEQLVIWQDVRLEQFAQLRQAGVEVRFFVVPGEKLEEIQAECVHVIHPLQGDGLLVAVIDRAGTAEMPEEALAIPLPAQDRPSIRTEAARLDAALKQDAAELAELANLIHAMQTELVGLKERAEFTVAARGALGKEHLFAVQGWLPAERSESLLSDLAAAGVLAAAQTFRPAPEEQPPTLIRYARWARPIKGLFDILGTIPGYKEIDLSPFFMVALPLFAAMIISDAGYGLLLTVLPLIFYRKLLSKAGAAQVHLLIIFGLATLIWGLLSGNVFGLAPVDFAGAGGPWRNVASLLEKMQLIRGALQQQAKTIMKLSFVFGTVHLSIAHIRRALAFAPNIRALASLGWTGFLWGVLGIVWYLFFDSQTTPPQPLHPGVPWLLCIGAGLAIAFEHPSRNIAKGLGLGLANFPLTAIGAFSDTISYIRLMAVGLASTVIARTFNALGVQVADAGSWFAGAPVILFGHALNIAMCMIAVLAHGVRLNMLEFSNNAGVQWAGYPYQPFSRVKLKES